MVRLGVAKIAARRGTLLKLAAAAIVAIACAASAANAEIYGGWNGSFDSDIHLVQPGGTNMTLNDVPWYRGTAIPSERPLLGLEGNLLVQ